MSKKTPAHLKGFPKQLVDAKVPSQLKCTIEDGDGNVVQTVELDLRHNNSGSYGYGANNVRTELFGLKSMVGFNATFINSKKWDQQDSGDES